MTALPAGAIDCDLHPAPPSVSALMPYLEPHWADAAGHRGLHELETIAWPPNAPLSCRPDWRDGEAKPGSNPARLVRDAVDGFGTRYAILNCLYGAPMLYSEDIGVGPWVRTVWLHAIDRCAGIGRITAHEEAPHTQHGLQAPGR